MILNKHYLIQLSFVFTMDMFLIGNYTKHNEYTEVELINPKTRLIKTILIELSHPEFMEDLVEILYWYPKRCRIYFKLASDKWVIMVKDKKHDEVHYFEQTIVQTAAIHSNALLYMDYFDSLLSIEN